MAQRGVDTLFGYVAASLQELDQTQRQRYMGAYCGICRAIGRRASGPSRLALNYDMVFLALLLSSLYEPEETTAPGRCLLHPLSARPCLSGPTVDYAADMNVALAFFSADDHWRDNHRPDALALRTLLKRHYPAIAKQYPRQCQAITGCISRLSRLEQDRCPNPDMPANCFGQLMGELFTWRQDRWTPYLREMAMALGRFIYFMDAAVDYRQDCRRGNYNPFAAMDAPPDPARWEQYLVLEMGRCTRIYEMLPLVQDKALLDNILYSGVWIAYRQKLKKESARRSNA
ncbi:MAG TPA: hypothetical protein IAB92_02270 [Candidatus Faecousia faecigallinarum]|nr:hypothetical protein [Candidatus Faecousia faecigallinarum]